MVLTLSALNPSSLRCAQQMMSTCFTKCVMFESSFLRSKSLVARLIIVLLFVHSTFSGWYEHRLKPVKWIESPVLTTAARKQGMPLRRNILYYQDVLDRMHPSVMQITVRISSTLKSFEEVTDHVTLLLNLLILGFKSQSSLVPIKFWYLMLLFFSSEFERTIICWPFPQCAWWAGRKVIRQTFDF